MEIQLTHQPSKSQPCTAAFLKGASAGDWIREMHGWNLGNIGFQGYLIPTSLANQQTAGILIIFSAPVDAAMLLCPYYCMADRLYLPIDSGLYPPVTESELNSLLHWPLQVFHPTIGLVGFETIAPIDWQQWFKVPNILVQDWSFAHPGNSPLPHLQSIRLGESMDVLSEIKSGIQARLLTEVPFAGKKSPKWYNVVIDPILMLFFGLLLLLAGLLRKLFPRWQLRSCPASSRTQPGGSNWLTKGIQQVQQWIQVNMEQLQERRKNELERLLGLFDKDSDEALQYALPLDSPYLNRGKAAPSSSLFKRHPQFNLGNLGGGGLVDSWDVGDYYSSLRAKYLKAANAAIEKNDFKKAAYIYAHLLGDLRGAANVLEQGNRFRDAAALYKDHLNDKNMAAACLEKGHLYTEAIDLYKQLNRHEKVGDLYLLLQNESLANEYFELTVAEKLQQRQHQEAAELLLKKMQEPVRSQEVLLQGWQDANLYESCLRAYFKQAASSQPLDELVKQVYRHHTAPHRKLALLTVLEHLNKVYPSETLTATYLDIAYEIIHESASGGNKKSVQLLQQFLPADPLIGADTRRYSYGSAGSKSSVSTGLPKLILLDRSVTWISARLVQNQLLVLGTRGNQLQLARVNWYGNIENYQWQATLEDASVDALIANELSGKYVFIKGVTVSENEKRVLLKNKHFSEQLTMCYPPWVQSGKNWILNNDEKLMYLSNSNGQISAHYHDLHGKFTTTPIALPQDFDAGKLELDANSLLVGKHLCIGFAGSSLFYYKLSSPGVHHFNFESNILLMSLAVRYPSEWLVVATQNGSQLCTIENCEVKLVTPSYFATDLQPRVIEFVGTNRFVLAGGAVAMVYEIVHTDVTLIQTYQANASIIAVLPSAEKNQYTLVTVVGEVVVIDMPSV